MEEPVVVVIEEAVLVELPPPALVPVAAVDVAPVPLPLPPVADVEEVVSLWQPARELHTAIIPVNALMPRNIILPLRTMRLLQECRERKANAARMAARAPPQPGSARGS
jgi:hypothetical protein